MYWARRQIYTNRLQAVGQVDSSIPLKMYHNRHQNVQVAVDECIHELKRSRKLFNEAEKRLLSTNAYEELDRKSQQDVQQLIQGWKNMIVGIAKFS